MVKDGLFQTLKEITVILIKHLGVMLASLRVTAQTVLLQMHN